MDTKGAIHFSNGLFYPDITRLRDTLNTIRDMQISKTASPSFSYKGKSYLAPRGKHVRPLVKDARNAMNNYLKEHEELECRRAELIQLLVSSKLTVHQLIAIIPKAISEKIFTYNPATIPDRSQVNTDTETVIKILDIVSEQAIHNLL